MKIKNNQLLLIKELWNFIPLQKKIFFYKLIFLALISSVAELFVIASVIPFLMNFVTSPTGSKVNFFSSFFSTVGFNNVEVTSIAFTALFCFLIFISGFLRLAMLRLSLRYSFSLGSYFSEQIYLFSLKATYTLNRRIKSSDLINAANEKVNIAIHNIFLPIINLLSSLITILIVLFFLIVLKPIPTILGLLLISFLFFSYNLLTNSFLDKNSEVIALKMNESLSLFQQGLASVKDITLSNQFNFFVSKFFASTNQVRLAQYKNAFIKFSPRYIFETFVVIAIVLILTYFNSSQSRLISYIPIIGMFCLTIYRLLPYFNQIYLSYSSIKGDFFILDDLFKFLRFMQDVKLDNGYYSKKLELKKNIILSNISFSYHNKIILKNISLKINKGEHLGIIGKSGSGKSTLADIIMSLFTPSAGHISVDNVIISDENCFSWRRNIAHVSQNFFITDGSIKDNIILGSNSKKFEAKKFDNALRFSQLKSFVDSLNQKYNSQVGEFGSALSGGERQRLAIARALYKNTDILVLDEATSSLDKSTEKLFIQSLRKFKGKKTIISISHNISSLVYCDFIIEIDKGLIIKSGRPSDFQKKYNFSI